MSLKSIHVLLFTILIRLSDTSTTKIGRIRIPKFCSLGEVLIWNDNGFIKCMNVTLGQPWTGFIYDDKTFEKRNASSVRPDYVFKSGKEPCENGWSIMLNSAVLRTEIKESSSPSIFELKKKDVIQSEFRLLSNGKLEWREWRCDEDEWAPFNAIFFMDGIGSTLDNGSSEEDGVYYSGKESDQMLYYCTDQFVYAHWYHTRNDKVFVGVLVTAAVIYLITVLIYGMLWSSFALPGRVMFTVVLARMWMAFMLALGYTGNLNGWSDSSAPTARLCVIIAVCAHYFTMSAYSWMTVLNFDLWWTFRNVRASLEHENLNRKYFLYSGFGWGVPFILVGTSVIIDSEYRHHPRMGHLAPKYGNGACFVMDCSFGIYIHIFTAIFLVPAFVLSVLTFRALYKSRRETAHVRDSKNGEKQSRDFFAMFKTVRFQLYLKLLVIMSLSWTISYFVRYFHLEILDTDMSKSFYVRSTIWLILHCGINFLGTSIFILVVFGLSKGNRAKLEQNYEMVHEWFERFRHFKMKFSNGDQRSSESELEPALLAPSTQL